MKRLPLVIVFLVFATSLLAQRNSTNFKIPDYTGIQNVISDPDSEFYYPELMERMKQCDTTLTLSEYRALYYGYIFQPGFSFLAMPERENELLKYYQSFSISQYDTIIEIINQILEEDPFYIRGLNFLGYILHLKGEEDQAIRTALRFRGVMGAILSTGEGKSPKNGYHVINAGHEYVVMNSLQLSFGDRTTQWINNNACDSFTLKQSRGNKICFIVPYSINNGSF